MQDPFILIHFMCLRRTFTFLGGTVIRIIGMRTNSVTAGMKAGGATIFLGVARHTGEDLLAASVVGDMAEIAEDIKNSVN